MDQRYEEEQHNNHHHHNNNNNMDNDDRYNKIHDICFNNTRMKLIYFMYMWILPDFIFKITYTIHNCISPIVDYIHSCIPVDHLFLDRENAILYEDSLFVLIAIMKKHKENGIKRNIQFDGEEKFIIILAILFVMILYISLSYMITSFINRKRY